MKYLAMILGLMVAGRHVAAEPLVVDDRELMVKMCASIGALAKGGKAMKGSALIKALAAAPEGAVVTLPVGLAAAKTYEERVKSVFMLAAVYNCGKCDKWHPMGAATAWCLTSDGVMVTNHHVFEKAKGEAWGVFGMDGKAYRVTGILAKNKAADVVLFKVEAENLTPLALGDPAEVGARVSIISHPDGRFYVNTGGEVARYAKAQGRDEKGGYWMAVTAEYAKGSSGGPVMDADGRVVGMVSNTQSITYGPQGKDPMKPQGPHQMVIRNCVPVAAISALVKTPEAAPAKDGEEP